MKGAKKLAEQLRLHRIHNQWELLMRCGFPGSVMIEYHRSPPGRIGWATANHTSVWSIRPVKGLERREQIGPVSYAKTFHGDKAESELEALRWVKDNLGYDPVQTPFGGYTDPQVMEKARKLAASAPKEVVL